MKRRITDPAELRVLDAMLLAGLEKYLRQFQGKTDEHDNLDSTDADRGSRRKASRLRA
jgi:hypothetical protein